MKVTFTCEKCGHEYKLYELVHKSGHEDGLCYYYWDNLAPCPRCHPPEPTYGPLTVEMVAEALARSCSHRFPEDGHDFAYMARFVLRLLKKVQYWTENERLAKPREHDDTGVNIRDWLLKLAKEK